MAARPLTAAAVAEQVRTGGLAPMDLVEEFLAHAARVEPEIHAFCTLDAEGARKAAADLDRRIAGGEDPGPLAGVPVGIKDLLCTGGLRTTFGSAAYRDHVPDEDDIAVERLRAAGAIVVGKTNTSEFGYAAVGDNLIFPSTRNPWNTALSPGGSSAGSAAAVAAGLVPLALGSDGGGSIRIPAALCGTVGFKPSMGRIPAYPGCKDERRPGVSSWDALEHLGPLTRTVADAALAYAILTGPDPRDRFSLPAAPATVARRPLDGLRMGLSYDWGYAAVEPEIRVLAGRAAEVFEGLGCVVELADPGFPDPFSAFGAMIANETDLRGLRELALKHEPAPYLRSLLDRPWTAEDFTDARAVRQRVCRTMAAHMERFDLLLTPTSPVPAFVPGNIGPTVIDGRDVDPSAWLSMTLPLNLTGQPAISLPAGLTADGLPVGIQLVGRHLADLDVLNAAFAFEEAAPWPVL